MYPDSYACRAGLVSIYILDIVLTIFKLIEELLINQQADLIKSDPKYSDLNSSPRG